MNKLHTHAHSKFVVLTNFFVTKSVSYHWISKCGYSSFHCYKTKPCSEIFKCSKNVSYIFFNENHIPTEYFHSVQCTFKEKYFRVLSHSWQNLIELCETHLNRVWLKFYLMHTLGMTISQDQGIICGKMDHFLNDYYMFKAHWIWCRL